jgi:hypothetical protein
MQYSIRTYNVRLEIAEKFVSCVGGPIDAERVARGIYAVLDADREHFTVLGLNAKRRITGQKVITSGSMSSAVIQPNEVFTAAVRLRAKAIVGDVGLWLLPKQIEDVCGNSPAMIFRHYAKKWIKTEEKFGERALKPKPEVETELNQVVGMVRGAGFEPARHFWH